METIINFVRSENYYLALYIFSMFILLFTMIWWHRSTNMIKELLEYNNLLKKKIIKFNEWVNPYLEDKPLSYLIDHLIWNIKTNIKYMGEKQTEFEAYKEKTKTEMDKLNQKINEMTILAEKTKKRDRRHIGTLYSQLAYRNKILLEKWVKLKNKKSKYC